LWGVNAKQWRQLLILLRVAYMDVGMACLSRTKYACMDAGMPNLSGTKFGRNGHNCYDRFAFATHRWGLRIVGRQCEAMAPVVNIAARCLHGRRYAEFVGNEIRP